jgi:phosphoribosylformimino-5-aminoimidazole carboxamide ribotide isomerase
MIAIPAVDLSEASHGRTRPKAEYAGVAAHEARALADIGFSRLHLESFGNGADGGRSLPAVESIVRDTDVQIQVAGPSSSTEIDRLFGTGAEYIVVGDRSIDEPEWLDGLTELYRHAIVVQTDVRDRRVVKRGWVRTLPVDVLDLVEELNELPLGGILVGGLQLEGPTRNADLSLIEDLAERSHCPILVSTKVGTVNDLRALEHRGAAAVVLRAGTLLSGVLDPRAVALEFGS